MKLIDPIYNIQSPLPQTPRAGYTMSETHIPVGWRALSSHSGPSPTQGPGLAAPQLTLILMLDSETYTTYNLPLTPNICY